MGTQLTQQAVVELIRDASALTGSHLTPNAVANLLLVAKLESGLRPDVTAPGSTATGLFQIVRATGRQLVTTLLKKTNSVPSDRVFSLPFGRATRALEAVTLLRSSADLRDKLASPLVNCALALTYYETLSTKDASGVTRSVNLDSFWEARTALLLPKLWAVCIKAFADDREFKVDIVEALGPNLTELVRGQIYGLIHQGVTIGEFVTKLTAKFSNEIVAARSVTARTLA